MTWYMDWFDEEYIRVYGHRDAAEARRDISFASTILQIQPQDRILDLCCGGGRHLLALCEMGYRNLTGVDLSMPLLKMAHQALRSCKTSSVLLADMRHLPFQGKFDVVLNLFTSFGYFEADEENLQVLSSMDSVLHPGGRFLLDYLNPEHVLSTLQPLTEKAIEDRRVIEKRKFDPIGKRVNKNITIESPEGTKHYQESVRLYSQEEMLEMFSQVELDVSDCYGDFDSLPYSENSPRMIFAGRKGCF